MTDIIKVEKAVKEALAKDEGYILLIFPFGMEVESQFSTNANPADASLALQAYVEEFARKAEIPRIYRP